MLFIDCDLRTKENICEVLNFKLGTLPIKYLGSPLFPSKLKAVDCYAVIEKVRNRLASWKSCILSMAGGVDLNRSTLSSLHIFWASSFLITKSILKLMISTSKTSCREIMITRKR